MQLYAPTALSLSDLIFLYWYASERADFSIIYYNFPGLPLLFLTNPNKKTNILYINFQCSFRWDMSQYRTQVCTNSNCLIFKITQKKEANFYPKSHLWPTNFFRMLILAPDYENLANFALPTCLKHWNLVPVWLNQGCPIKSHFCSILPSNRQVGLKPTPSYTT